MHKINVSSLMQSEINKRDKKDKHDRGNLSKAIEFIRTLMEKEEANSKASASLATAAVSSDTTKSAFRSVVGQANDNSRQHLLGPTSAEPSECSNESGEIRSWDPGKNI